MCGALSNDELDALNKISRTRKLRAGQRIVADQESPDSFAVILSGTIKLSKVLADGRQQIVGLLFPSDFLGRPFAKLEKYHAEAATDVQVCSFPAAAFENVMKEHRGIESRLFQNALDELDAAQEWMLVLGRKTARERVATLLLLIARRTWATCDRSTEASPATQFDIPLSRADVGDFLGLTLETVSRQLAHLKSEGIITLAGPRTVTVRDMAKLEAAATSNE